MSQINITREELSDIFSKAYKETRDIVLGFFPEDMAEDDVTKEFIAALGNVINRTHRTLLEKEETITEKARKHMNKSYDSFLNGFWGMDNE